MPESTPDRRVATAAFILIAVAVLTVATPALVSAATPSSPSSVGTSAPQHDLIWGVPTGMALWALAGLVAVVVGLIVAAMPARKFKSAATVMAEPSGMSGEA